MNHVKKMALVDPRLLPAQPDARRMSDLDERMKNILERLDLNEVEKVKLYNQALQKYIVYEDKSNQPPPPVRVMVTDDENQVDDAVAINSRDMEAEVMESVPKNYRKKVALLLERLKRNKNLSWNDKGEMVYKGEVYRNSNIVDLVNDIARKRKDFKAVGSQTFTTALKEINIPRELVGNLERWEEISDEPLKSSPKKPLKKSPHKRLTKQQLWPGQIKRWTPY